VGVPAEVAVQAASVIRRRMTGKTIKRNKKQDN